MTLCHAVWSPSDTLLIWAEAPLRSPRLPRPSGRPPADDRPRRHPYALLARDLLPALEALTGARDDRPAATAEAVVVLPSAAHAPLPSPHLPGASAVTAPRAGLAAWRADAIELSGADLLDVLLALPGDRSEGPPTTTADQGLAALADLAVLVVEHVAHGRVLPGLVRRAGAWEARWQPVADPALRRQLTAAAQALPPSLLAAAGEDHRSPGAVTREVVEQLTDAAARAALTRTALTTDKRGRRRHAAPAVEEAWLAALTAADPRLDPAADDHELTVLAKELDAWHRSATTGPLRTVFRLVPPPSATLDDPDVASDDAAADDAPTTANTVDDAGTTTDDRWAVELLLQATDDPSLLVPAAEVWAAGRTLTFLEHTFAHPQEQLLTDLGRAARLWPELTDTALADATPTTALLDTDEVAAFLRDTAPLLEQAGFDVLLPTELRSPARLTARLATRSRTSSSSSSADSQGLLGYEGILDYRWHVAVGDMTVTADELTELARLKHPLVRFRGRWVAVDQQDLTAALRLLEQPAGTMPMAEAARIGLGTTDPEVGLPVAGVEADAGPLRALLSDNTDAVLESLDTPDGFAGTLRPYQARGLAWLAFLGQLGLGGCLADDMGLGKTLQLLALLVHERAPLVRAGVTRRSKRWPAPTLLICPMSVVGNWEREAARFAPDLAVHVHHGSDRLDGDELTRTVRRADLVITTYATAARDRDALAAVDLGRIALDEAQAIKNPQAKQTRAIRSLDAPHRVALTGTPVENHLTELWSIMDFCNPGLLGSQSAFRSRFAVPIEKLRDDEAAASLRRVTRPFLLRRVKTDRTIIADLPDKLEFDERCTLTREQASLYRAVVDDMLAKVEASEGIERKGLVLTTMLRLKQVCNHPAQLLADGSRLPARSGKLDRLEELLDEILDNGERALIFTQFAEWGGRLAQHLRDRLGRDVAFLHGGTTKRARDAMVASFQSGDGPPVFVLSLKAGGTGLNLTAANHVIHYDRWWNPAVEDQATDRAFRIGQRRDVLVRRFVCAGTLEERIAELIRRKRDLAERVVGTGEGWLTELSTDELREVVALSADAVAE